jgi:hypothetical protein
MLLLALAPQEPLSADDFEKLHAEVAPKAREKWQSIAWKTDLLDARDAAAREGKLLFLWSMNGHPLGCT